MQTSARNIDCSGRVLANPHFTGGDIPSFTNGMCSVIWLVQCVVCSSILLISVFAHYSTNLAAFYILDVCY